MSKRLNSAILAIGLLAAGTGGLAAKKCSGDGETSPAQAESLDAEATAEDAAGQPPPPKKYLSPATREQLLRWLSGEDSSETPDQLLQRLFDQSLEGNAGAQRKLWELFLREERVSVYLNALAKERGIGTQDFAGWCFYAAEMNDAIKTIQTPPDFNAGMSERHNLMEIYKPLALAAYELLQGDEGTNSLQNEHFLRMVGQTESSLKDLFLETKDAIGTDADTAYVLHRLGMTPQE
ncbi:MAG: hypothetical protein AAB606_04630 [Patescibacteria group bacterium]